jgi:hypothetical protein
MRNLAALIKRFQVTKIRLTEPSGVEHEFEGAGYFHLDGIGGKPNIIQAVTVHLTLGDTNGSGTSDAGK